MGKELRCSNSFVLRLWWEEGESGAAWRGWIQHAITGETRYFHRLAELLDFVEAYTGPLVRGSDVNSLRGGVDK